MQGRPKISFGLISLKKPEPEEVKDSSESSNVTSNEQGESSGFGSFSFPKEKEVTEEEEEMARVMGFTDFRFSTKMDEKPKTKVDVQKIVDEIKKSRLKCTRVASDTTIESKVENISLEKVEEEEVEEEEEEEEEIIGPMPANVPQVQSTKNSDDDDDDNDDNDDDEKDESEESDEDVDQFPVAERMTLNHGSKPISSFCIDPAATRFATGSFDYEVRLWDFSGIKNRHPFRTMKPFECHPIKNVSYSSSGDCLLLISGSAQAKVVDRDGSEILECVKGDQYIVDMSRTKGHVASLTCGYFNPKRKEKFMTSSDDGTCRVWDVNRPREHEICVKLRSSSGLKNRATACCFGREGNTFFGAGLDGTVCMWDTRRPLVVPTVTLRSAHGKNTETTCLVNSYSGLYFVSRGEDSVLNIWDTRNFKAKLFSSPNFPLKYSTTDATFSPNDKFLLVPVLAEGFSGHMKGEKQGSKLQFISTIDHTCHKEIEFEGDVGIRTAWHHRLNQIMVTFGSGNIGIYYDLATSTKGAVLAHGKEPKRERPSGVVQDMSGKIILTPNALPMFKNDKPRNLKREEAKARLDPIKSRRPDLPITAGSGGRVAASGSTLSSYVIRNLGLSKRVKDNLDPREAILKYAKDAAENPIWVTPAYKTTQPVPIFASQDDNAPDPKKQKTV